MKTLQLPVGKLDAIVTVFDPEDAAKQGIPNWSLKHLQRDRDKQHCHLLVKGISQKMRELGINDAFAPHVAAASGHIVNTADLTNRIRLKRSNLHRNPGLPADGVFLDTGNAFMMSSSGCPIIMASAGNEFIAAHAGRDSLIDRGAVMGTPIRRHISVVDTIVEKFERRGALPRDIVMVMLFAIPAEAFVHHENHPQYGPFNRALADFVGTHWHGGVFQKQKQIFLDLEKVFVEQALQQGVRQVWAAHSLLKYPSMSHTRDGKDTERRNLIIVKRTS